MQLSAGIHHVIGYTVISFIVKLVFADHIAPFQVSLIAEGEDSHIICMKSHLLVAAGITPPPP